MHIFHIKISNIEEQTKLFHNLYKDNLSNILNSNINNIVSKIIFTKSKLK